MCASVNSKVHVRWASGVSVGPDDMALRTGNGFSLSSGSRVDILSVCPWLPSESHFRSHVRTTVLGHG